MMVDPNASPTDNKRPDPPRNATEFWMRAGARILPFADAASADLPLGRLLRLSLFQASVGMAAVLLTGALNRVMIVELSAPASLVAIMVSLPLVFAPLRALIGHRSDVHRSVLGWRRGPFIWFGALMQYGGFAFLPFALLVLSGGGYAPAWIGYVSAAIGFLMVGAGMHTVQTAGLALATDLAPEEDRPRVVALLYVTLLISMSVSAFVFGSLLHDFSPQRLVQIVQSAAVATMALNVIALWKQEPRDRSLAARRAATPSFRETWTEFTRDKSASRLLVAVGLGAAGFNMQDVLLEPYGGEILGMSVGETTQLTMFFALGTLFGFAVAARRLSRGTDPYRLAGVGALVGAVAFAIVIFADPLGSAALFIVGVSLIGLGGGLFSVSTLTAVMAFSKHAGSGVALGAWGAVQATAAGVAIAFAGLVRDGIDQASLAGALGPALADKSAGYSVVYHVEVLLLFATLAAVGPLARRSAGPPQDDGAAQQNSKMELPAFPG